MSISNQASEQLEGIKYHVEVLVFDEVIQDSLASQIGEVNIHKVVEQKDVGQAIDKKKTSKESIKFVCSKGCPISHLAREANKTSKVVLAPKHEARAEDGLAAEQEHIQLTFSPLNSSVHAQYEKVSELVYVLQETKQPFVGFLSMICLSLAVQKHEKHCKRERAAISVDLLMVLYKWLSFGQHRLG